MVIILLRFLLMSSKITIISDTDFAPFLNRILVNKFIFRVVKTEEKIKKK